MRYEKILLTGGSGTLGNTILKSDIFQNILAPTHNELDISDKDSISKFFQDNEFDAVIHCAANTNMQESEENLPKLIEVNVKGTCNLVNAVLKKEKGKEKKIRFVHISTDGVYNRTEGNYSETSPTIPFDRYGWSKLGAECSVNSLSNFCIIRTNFSDPTKINFKTSPTDAYSSRILLKELVNVIKFLLESDFKGTINVGGQKKSHYDAYKEFNPSLTPCNLEDIQNKTSRKLPKDSSMDISLLEKLKTTYFFK